MLRRRSSSDRPVATTAAPLTSAKPRPSGKALFSQIFGSLCPELALSGPHVKLWTAAGGVVGRRSAPLAWRGTTSPVCARNGKLVDATRALVAVGVAAAAAASDTMPPRRLQRMSRNAWHVLSHVTTSSRRTLYTRRKLTDVMCCKPALCAVFLLLLLFMFQRFTTLVGEQGFI